jgi:hypothetical protein
MAPAEVPEMPSMCRPGSFLQTVQDAPGEGAVGPAALECEIHR